MTLYFTYLERKLSLYFSPLIRSRQYIIIAPKFWWPLDLFQYLFTPIYPHLSITCHTNLVPRHAKSIMREGFVALNHEIAVAFIFIWGEWISYLDRLTHSRKIIRLASVICIFIIGVHVLQDICGYTWCSFNPRQKSLAHLDQMARKYVDKVFWGQYLMASLE